MGQQLSLFESHRPNDSKYSYFLALFPGPDIAERIIELGNTLRIENGMHSRMRPLSHLHLSLHFFGYGPEVSKTLVQVLDLLLKTVGDQFSPFDIEFSSVLSFRGRPGNHPLVLVGDDQRNATLKKLHQALEMKLVLNRLSSRSNNKFVPHLTLLYDKQILSPTPIDPVVWRVEEIVLIRSEVGATKYERPGRWKLGS